MNEGPKLVQNKLRNREWNCNIEGPNVIANRIKKSLGFVAKTSAKSLEKSNDRRCFYKRL